MTFYMRHVEREILSALIDGELTPDERRFVHDHLKQCEPCREVYQEFAHIHGMVGGLPQLVAPESFVSAALSPPSRSVVASAVSWTSRHPQRWIIAGVAAVATAVTLAGLAAPQPSSEVPVERFIDRHVSVHSGVEDGGQVLFAVNGR